MIKVCVMVWVNGNFRKGVRFFFFFFGWIMWYLLINVMGDVPGFLNLNGFVIGGI